MPDNPNIALAASNLGGQRGTKSVWLGLAGWLALCFGAAYVGSLLTTPHLEYWYASLAKPEWTPPNWIFGPVWTALYAMMAVAAWLVWKQGGHRGNGVALELFIAQLALNVLWSALFFALCNIEAAAFGIVLLWLTILATTIAFRRHSRLAALLMIPYLAWVAFASLLNFAIWRLNS